MKLNIYRVEGLGNYAGALAIVAAEDSDKAVELANQKEGQDAQRDTVWDIVYHEAKELPTLSTTLETPTVITTFEFGE